MDGIASPHLAPEVASTSGARLQRNGLTPEATPACIADVLHLLGSAADDWSRACPVRLWRVRSGATLHHEGAAAEALHVVRSGSFKCLTVSTDGYEHVLGFAGAGEVLGFEGLALDCQPHAVLALEDSSVWGLPLRDLDTWRRESPALDRALQRALSAQLARAGEIAGMMAALAVDVRLARFLVWLSSRMASLGQSPRRLLLRMNRRDIASMLGVAHETVSRGLGMLSDRGILKVHHREIEILDLDGLKSSTRCVRRDPEAATTWRTPDAGAPTSGLQFSAGRPTGP